MKKYQPSLNLKKFKEIAESLDRRAHRLERQIGRRPPIDIDGNPNYKKLEQRKFRVDMIKQKKKVKVSSSNRDMELNEYGDKVFNDTPN